MPAQRASWISRFAAALWLAAASACGGPARATSVAGCAPPIDERLDPRSTIHLFPGATEPHYLTDPPTSGPHLPGLPYRGVVGTPISRPSQVAMLESGFVILQQRGLPPDQVAVLDALAGDLVTVAPPAGPLPRPVVATAWTWKLECDSVAPAAFAALKAFVAVHRGVGFNGHPPVATPPP